MKQKKAGKRPEAGSIDESLFSNERIEAELYREKYRSKYFKLLRNTIYALIIVAAVSILIATFFLPVLEIYGSSMSPTLSEGEIAVCLKQKSYLSKDICSFYYNNKVLVKRVIACPMDTVSIDDNGVVYVNGLAIDEPYLTSRALGNCNIDFPFHVPAETYFVLGDNRENSIDSRMGAVGCISQDEMIGKLILVIWPFPSFGKVT